MAYAVKVWVSKRLRQKQRVKRTSLHSEASTNSEDEDEQDERSETGGRSVTLVTDGQHADEQNSGGHELGEEA